MHPYQRQIDLCNQALEAVKNQLSSECYQDVHADINLHDEWGVGMEFLMDWIDDEDVKISRVQFDSIFAAMIAMGMDKNPRVVHLREHCVKD